MILVTTDVVQHADVRMSELRDGPRFLLESTAQLGVDGRSRRASL